MLGGGQLVAGSYEWRLDTASYLARNGTPTLDRSFLPAVTVRFAVMNPEQHFHVPVLLSPRRLHHVSWQLNRVAPWSTGARRFGRIVRQPVQKRFRPPECQPRSC